MNYYRHKQREVGQCLAVSNAEAATVIYLDISESFVVTDARQFGVASTLLSISMR